jgi:hypothetical protein
MGQRAKIVGCLVEGMSIHATVHVTGAAKNAVVKLHVDVGKACAEYQDAEFVNRPCRRVEWDEIWSYWYSKQKNIPEAHRGEFGYGDVWTWTAICADIKLVPSWIVGERTVSDAVVFMNDLANRLRHRVQLSTDGHRTYLRLSSPRSAPMWTTPRSSKSTARRQARVTSDATALQSALASKERHHCQRQLKIDPLTASEN